MVSDHGLGRGPDHGVGVDPEIVIFVWTILAPSPLGGVQSTPDPDTSAEASRYKWEGVS